MKSAWPRAIMLIGVALLIIGYEWVYSTMTAPLYTYMGFSYDPPTPTERLWIWAASLIPVSWLPITIRRPSHILYIFWYLFVYFPSIQMIYLMDGQDPATRSLLTISLVFGMGISALGYLIPASRLTNRRWSEPQFLKFMIIVFTIGLLLNLWAYRGQMQFVSFELRTDHRLAMRAVNTNFLTDYAMAHIVWGIGPFFMVLGLARKRLNWFALGVTGEVVMYAASAARSFVLVILFVPMVYYLAHLTKWRLGQWLPLVVGSSFFALLGLNACGSRYTLELQIIYFQRCFVNSGAMTNTYFDFFSRNPYTFGSHLKGVNLILDYPYDLPVCFLIGEHLGDFENSANAHMWGDGIAIAGPIGIIAVSFVLSGVFWVLDTASSTLNPRHTALTIAAYSMPLANLSLFSVLLGSGLGFMILLLAVMPEFEPQTLTRSDQPSPGRRRFRTDFSTSPKPRRVHSDNCN